MEKGESEIRWTSQTRGDWDGVAFQFEQPQTELQLNLGEYEETVDPSKLEQGMTSRTLGESDQLLIVKGEPKKLVAEFTMKDRSILYKWNYYYLRVLQADGEMAWSSPIWIRKK